MKELLPMINKNDNRSAVSWCKKNELDIFKDSSGKYVIEGEFYLAYNRKVIERYKSKYGNSWEVMFELCANKKLYASKISEIALPSERRYKPQGNVSKNFSKRLNN